MATRITGLDIGSTAVRAVVLNVSFRGFELVEAVEERFPFAPAPEPTGEEEPPTDEEGTPRGSEDTDEASPRIRPEARAAIERLFERNVLPSDVVITTIGEDAFYLTTLELPFSGKREIAAVLMSQLDGHLPEDVEDLHLDFMRVGQKPSGQHLLYAGGIEHQELQGWIESWAELNLDPRIVDVSPFHLFTAASWLLPRGEGEAVALLDLGSVSSRLVILRDGKLELARTIHAGGELVTEELAAEFGLDLLRAREGKHREAALLAPEDEADATEDQRRASAACARGLRPVVRDVRRTLQAHAAETGSPIGRLWISGGASALGGLTEHLTREVGVPVDSVPLDRPELSAVSGFREHGHRFVTALGLALRGTSWPEGSRFNLRHGPYESRGSHEYLTSRVPALLTMAGALLVATFWFLFGHMALLKAEHRAVDDALGLLTQDVFGAEVRSPTSVRTFLMNAAGGSELLPEHSAYDILAEISHAAGDARAEGHELTLSSVDVDLNRRIISVSGTCNSAQAAEQLRTLIEGTSCARRVRRTALSERSGGSDLTFTLEGEANCEPGNEVQP